MSQISRLIYTSRAKVVFSAEMLERLTNKAMRNNAKLNVTGLLLYGGGRFLQLLEGDADTIQDLYKNTIVPDERHTHCTVLMQEPWAYRLFPNWGMGRLFLQDREGIAQVSWDALCREIAKQSPAAVFARDPAVQCFDHFIKRFGDELDAAMLSAWAETHNVA